MKDSITSYQRPLHLPGGHLQTIVHALTRKVTLPKPYQRERITTPDDDFLDLDWIKQGSKKLLILCHGLEGSSNRPYMKGMARHFFNHGFDILALNYRGCSGEMNKAKRMYHSGATDDLDVIVQHAAEGYDDLFLIGFSLGGNMMLKYLGEQGEKSIFRKAVAFSVPLDLYDGVMGLDQGFNMVYVRRFLNTLKEKVIAKSLQFPGEIDIRPLVDITTVYDFDDTYTSWIHGFHGASDYYYQNSSIRFIDKIKTKTLIVNAANDPMIGKIASSPEPFKDTDAVHFHLTTQGGHVGYYGYKNDVLWSEKQALAYMMN